MDIAFNFTHIKKIQPLNNMYTIKKPSKIKLKYSQVKNSRVGNGFNQKSNKNNKETSFISEKELSTKTSVI